MVKPYTNGNLRSPILFVHVYDEVHARKTSISDIKFDKSNLQMRQHVRDHLLKNELIFSPTNVEAVM